MFAKLSQFYACFAKFSQVYKILPTHLLIWAKLGLLQSILAKLSQV